MKKSTLALLASMAAFSPLSYADINEELQNICTIVKNDDKSELRKKMRTVRSDYRLRLGDYYTGISCGGNSMIRYAMENGSAETGIYMIKRMSKGDLEQPEGDGMTIKQWAEANGHIGTPIGKELLDRLN
ncbi:hypothetical protein HMF8227_00580 [Saliniradius amylolyticus]|uniref:DUF3718 domain-containing protein n=1 Tax=Saliniradius amylolyticus TaxID=2183582 RepID=A0A2S2E0C4_9ALTE|nr:DUF3718 domain-containing protein [Saliniradius amylolyticus]AWL11076.1 hypothetical protein HMF8227_00580 [Saliniradius amylolyticus]